jgi:hypothetical protein
MFFDKSLQACQRPLVHSPQFHCTRRLICYPLASPQSYVRANMIKNAHSRQVKLGKDQDSKSQRGSGASVGIWQACIGAVHVLIFYLLSLERDTSALSGTWKSPTRVDGVCGRVSFYSILSRNRATHQTVLPNSAESSRSGTCGNMDRT